MHLRIISFLLVLCTSLLAKAQTWNFTDRIGGPNKDIGSQIALDEQGNCFVTGTFQQHSFFSGAVLWTDRVSNAYLAKYDPSGTFIWTKVIGSSVDSQSSIHVYALAVDNSGNVFLAGNYEGNVTFGGDSYASEGLSEIFITKLDNNGNVLWLKRAGRTSLGSYYKDAAYSLAVDRQGNCYVTGDYNSAITFDTVALHSPQTSELFVAKLDSEGNVMWAKTGSGGGIHYSNGIAVDKNGSCIITGSFFENMTIDSISVDPGDAESKMFLAKFDSIGTLRWLERIGSGGYYGSSNDVVVDDSGNSYITGLFRASMDIAGNHYSHDHFPYLYGLLVAKFDPSGQVQWASSTSGPDQSSTGNKIALDSNGNAVVTGYFSNSTSFGAIQLLRDSGTSTFVTTLDTAGHFVRALPISGSGNNIGYSVSIDRSNNPIVLGEFSDTISFDGVKLASLGSSDVFIASLNSAEEGVSTPLPKQSTGLCYPNPAKNVLHSSKRQDITIVDPLGREIKSCKQCEEINIEDLQNGIYYVNGSSVVVNH